ncbi:MAG TPA: hypothetical protein VGR20_20390, partial [Acidimicrobiia bacterium]|nr:hypothetical protein [Acidimicrobiia bacterium]
ATGVALGLIAGLVSAGDAVPRGDFGGGSGFGSALNGGEVWFYASVLTWFWGWMALRRRAIRVFDRSPDLVRQFRPFWRMAGEGALAFAGLATGLAVAGFVFGLVVADGGAARLGEALGLPVVGFSLGAAVADGAMGAALAGGGGHTSLFHFGLPAGPASGAAPAWLFAALLLAPVTVGAAVWRRLGRDRPADEQRALATGAAVAAGFAGAAWLAALVGRVALIAYVGPTLEGGWLGSLAGLRAGMHGAAVDLRPNPASVLGLSLMWGVAGGVGAALVWAGRHGAHWQLPATGGAAAGTAGAPEPRAPTAAAPASGPSAWLLPESPSATAEWGPPRPSPPAPGPVGQPGGRPSGPPGGEPSGPGATDPASGAQSGAGSPSDTGGGPAGPAGTPSPWPGAPQGAEEPGGVPGAGTPDGPPAAPDEAEGPAGTGGPAGGKP